MSGLCWVGCGQCNTFFYNVFRATRYKTTSLPAVLNQARRIDTLLWICIVKHLINWSRIYWRPSLCMYYTIDEDNSWRQIKLMHHEAFSLSGNNSSGRYKDSFSPVFHSVSQRKYRWCLYVVNLQYSKPDNLLHYITIHYFIFFWFFWFLYHSQAKCRESICCLR